MGKKRVAAQSGAEVKERSHGPKKTGSRGKITNGRIYISSSYNNTKVMLSDEKGNALLWSTSGRMGFKGTKKGTPFASSKVTDFVVEAAQGMGMQQFEVYVSGIGSGRDAALRAIAAKGLDVTVLRDRTPIPHNGPRPRKVRRA